MARGHYYQSKKKRSPWKPLLIIFAVVFCLSVAAVVFWKRGESIMPPSTGDPSMDVVTEASEGSQETHEKSAALESNAPAETTQAQSPVQETEPIETVTPATVVLVEKVEATYEEWLAAGMVVAISMEYPEFEIEGIYLAGETDLSERQNSSGVYVVFTADGTKQTVHGFPLAAERTQKGTVDLHTMDLGFAAFDPVETASVNTGACRQIGMEDLSELIAQSILVSLYEH